MQTTQELAAEAEAALKADHESAAEHVERLVKAGFIRREAVSEAEGSCDAPE